MLKVPSFKRIEKAIKMLSEELGKPENEIIDLLMGVKTPTIEQIKQWAEQDRKNDLELELHAAQYLK